MSQPSPSPSKRSPWIWPILGCSLFVLLGFAGCIAGVGLLGKQVYTEVQKPVNEDEIIAALEGIPIYQPSEFDPEGTKILRGSTAILPDNIVVTHAAFDSPDSAKTLTRWYQTKMSDLGYESEISKVGPTTVLQFHRNRDRLQVHLQSASTGPKGSSILALFRYQFTQPQEK
jgi:hypothetical protein